MRIAVIGYSGAGKSTLCKFLSLKYNLPLLYLDTVQFENNWAVRDKNEAYSIVKKFLENKEWVIDGNYSKFLQEERLSQADRIIFLDFNRIICLVRAFKRFRKYKGKTRESMADGCNEKFDMDFIWWILHKGRSQKVKKQFNYIKKKYKNKITILKNQKQIDMYMKKINKF